MTKPSQNLRSDLNIYSAKKLESTFVNISIPNKQNLIAGTINPPMKPHKLNNILLLLSKQKNENTILTGDLNHNLLNYNKKPETHLFMERIFTSNFLPQITTQRE